MPSDHCEIAVCLEINGDICIKEKETNAVVAAEKGELFIFRGDLLDVHVAVGEVTPNEAEIEIIGLSHRSVLYNGKSARLPLGGEASYAFTAENGATVTARVIYRKSVQ